MSHEPAPARSNLPPPRIHIHRLPSDLASGWCRLLTIFVCNPHIHENYIYFIKKINKGFINQFISLDVDRYIDNDKVQQAAQCSGVVFGLTK